MMVKYVWFIIFIIACPHLHAQQAFPADAVPGSLKPYAHAVVRLSENTYRVESLSEVTITRHHVVTVLNSKGVDEGIIVVPYNKLAQVKKLDAVIYDATGKVIRKVKMSGFEDLSMMNHFSLFEDDRMKRYDPQVSSLPYTVEYNCEIKLKTTFFLPPWKPQNHPGLAVEKSSASYVVPASFPIRMITNLLPEADITDHASGKHYSWTIDNRPAWRDEPFLPPVRTFTPWVEAAPVHFAIDGMKGTYSTWEEYGRWCYLNLLKDNNHIPDATAGRIQDMVKDIDSPYDKARVIYEYCQRKNRYVSIQKGATGGIRPMKAGDVDRLSYGDCKALSNYTRVLLGVAGIESYYAEVYANPKPVDPLPGFANALTGNHIILCVPMANDTVWLECTSDKLPFGYLGNFTGNRTAILFSEKGGKLVRTTQYPAESNRQDSFSEFILTGEGQLSGNVSMSFCGTQYSNRDESFLVLNQERTDELKKMYHGFPEMSVISYQLKFDKDRITASEQLNLESSRFASVTENRMYVPVNPVNRVDRIPDHLRLRTHDIYVSGGYMDTDSIKITIPLGYMPEGLPQPVILDNAFGNYCFFVKTDGREITVYRRLLINPGVFPKEEYNNMIAFYKKVSGIDHSRLVLVKY